MFLIKFFNKKINIKDSFKYPFPQVSVLEEYKNVDKQGAWKTISSTLEAGKQIYSYRIDTLDKKLKQHMLNSHKGKILDEEENEENENSEYE